jgi:4-oxalomesaconate tautomerase
MLRIFCVLMRAGTSKAAFLFKNDLHDSLEARDTLILKLMGSPDIRQVDGIGGGDPLSSKVAIRDIYDSPHADISFLFAQVLLDKPEVNTQPNCGNILARVASFAIEKGLVKTVDPETTVKIYNENTGAIIIARVQTPKGIITYQGNVAIDGVPGAVSPILLNFGNVIGINTEKLFPTGNLIDTINGIKISCLDVSIPVIFVIASDLGKNGNETKQELDNDNNLLQMINEIRKEVILKISSLIPKLSLVSKPLKEGNITLRYFTPISCHAAHAVTGALCLSVACNIQGTISSKIVKIDGNQIENFIVEHPSGIINISAKIKKVCAMNYILENAFFIRTARPLFDGYVLIKED